MNLLDIVIILLVISALFRGREIGLVRQFFSTAGFIGGLFLGAALEPHTIALVHSSASRSLVTIMTTLGTAFILLTIGEYIGASLKHRVQYWRINKIDSLLGSLIATATLLAAVWLGAAIFTTLPYPRVQSEVRGSVIVSYLDRSLPPAPHVIAGLGRLIDPNGFPKVFSGNEPVPPSNNAPPGLDGLQTAVAKDRASVVKLEGLGCGGVVEGSGFIVGSDLIATNAHVVAGVRNPYAVDSNGQHTATPIWFDSKLDFAILRVHNLAGMPLTINTAHVNRNTIAAVLGYPGGGPFEADGAQVLDEFTASGRDIYNASSTERDVYELAAKVIPGNSGGPLVAANGMVIGVVFAQSTVYNNVGYALSTPQIMAELNQAKAQDQVVSTGNCAE